MSELSTYNRKRDFSHTPEPAGRLKRGRGDRFVIQKHAARRLHYDFRLELDGVLKSWAVPKGPSLDPTEKRLAVEVEDHPLSYATFEGRIPEHQYGAGQVEIWDRGSWRCEGDAREQLRKGHLRFSLDGEKLHGRWDLVRTRQRGDKPSWLLIKVREAAAAPVSDGPSRRKPDSGSVEPRRRAAPSPSEPSRAERAAATLRLTHPGKILFPPDGPTKQELAAYYARVVRRMWPHVEGRPLAFLRCPDGIKGECFFQKHLEADPESSGLGEVSIVEKKGETEYRYLVEPVGLLSAVQLGALELHTWGSQVSSLERPDTLVFDLDPAPDVRWADVVRAAHELRALLARLKLKSYPKLTGGKGIHVQVPIATRYAWDDVKRFCEQVALTLVGAAPERYTATAGKALRQGKIYIDYLRNQRGAHYIAAFSPRAREGAPIAVPVSWTALTGRLRPNAYTVRTIDKYLTTYKRNPWGDYFRLEQKILPLEK